MSKKRGRGMAGGWYGIARTASIDRAATWAELDDGGTVKIVTGVTEIGEGILTVLAQIAAEEFGVRPQDVTIGDNDTARAPEAAHAGATRQTYMIGNSVALACREARGRFFDALADIWDVDSDIISAANGEVWAEGTNYRLSMAAAIDAVKKKGIVPVGSASFTADHTGLDPVDGSGRPWQAYVFGCQVAEVEVDTITGEVQVLGIWAAHDVGRAVNPARRRGADRGRRRSGSWPRSYGGLQDQGGQDDDTGLREIHPAHLARRSPHHLCDHRGPRSVRTPRCEGDRRAGNGADHPGDHERHLRRHWRTHHGPAGLAGADRRRPSPRRRGLPRLEARSEAA